MPLSPWRRKNSSIFLNAFSVHPSFTHRFYSAPEEAVNPSQQPLEDPADGGGVTILVNMFFSARSVQRLARIYDS